MEWLQNAIAEAERELEALDQRRSEYEHAIATLRKLAPADTGKTKALKGGRTNERTNASVAPACSAEPP